MGHNRLDRKCNTLISGDGLEWQSCIGRVHVIASLPEEKYNCHQTQHNYINECTARFESLKEGTSRKKKMWSYPRILKYWCGRVFLSLSALPGAVYRCAQWLMTVNCSIWCRVTSKTVAIWVKFKRGGTQSTSLPTNATQSTPPQANTNTWKLMDFVGWKLENGRTYGRLPCMDMLPLHRGTVGALPDLQDADCTFESLAAALIVCVGKALFSLCRETGCLVSDRGGWCERLVPSSMVGVQ